MPGDYNRMSKNLDTDTYKEISKDLDTNPFKTLDLDTETYKETKKKKKKKKNKGGRPTDYSLEIAIEICKKIAEGKSIATITKDEEMPRIATIYLWLAAHKEFMELYATAKADKADTLFEQMLDITDDVPDGDNADIINKAKLQLETRKYVISKLKPNKYGESNIINNNTLNVHEQYVLKKYDTKEIEDEFK